MKEVMKKGEEGRGVRLWCSCVKASNDRVQSSGPTGLRPTLCSVISDRPGTLEPLLRHRETQHS